MSWLSEHRHWLLFAGVVLTTVGALGLTVLGVVTTVTTLIGGGPLLPTLAVVILGAFLLVGLDFVFAVALVAELARRASLPKSQRVADGLARLESLVPPFGALGLSDRFEPPEPTIEERREALTKRYVDGELSEAELERRLRALLDEETDDRPTERWSPHTLETDASDRETATESTTTEETERERTEPSRET